MKIVFSDVDGTFQDFGLPIPSINIQSVKEMQKKGHKFVFVTGRGYDLAKDLLPETGITCDIIFGNGGGIKKVNEEPKFFNGLNHSTTLQVLNKLEQSNIFYFVHTDKGAIVSNMSRYKKHISDLKKAFSTLGESGREIMKVKEKYFRNDCLNVSDLPIYIQKNSDLHIIKIELMEISDETRESLRNELKFQGTYIFESYFKTLEVVHPLSTKGNAIIDYMKDYPNAISYGLGDRENDCSMFEVVDVSVAMGNASPEIKSMCNKVAGNCHEGGVGYFIQNEINL